MSLVHSCKSGPSAMGRRSFMAQPFKHPQSGIFYLRRKVPTELRHALGNEFKRSLKTKDPLTAKARFATAWTESEAVFAKATSYAQGVKSIGVEDAQEFASAWFRETQTRLEQTGRFTDELVSDGTFCDEVGNEYEVWKTLRQALEDNGEQDEEWPQYIDNTIKAALRNRYIPVPGMGSAAYKLLAARFDEQMRRMGEWALKRQEGLFAPLDPAPTTRPHVITSPQQKRSAGRNLLQLFESYADDKKLNDGDTRATRRTIEAYRAVITGFMELHPNLSVEEITRETISLYRASLAKLPAKGTGIRGLTVPQLIQKAAKEGLPTLSEPTIRNRLLAVSAVLSHGLRLGWLQENPVIASGASKAASKAASRKKASTRKRNHYTKEELRLIFASPALTNSDWAPPRADFGKAWQWLPILLYYTGARREEIAQLSTNDVRQSEDGIWHLNILSINEEGDEGEGERGVKNDSSRRIVPLHADVLSRGFIAYRDSLPKGGPLFPKLKSDPMGYFGSNFGKRWSTYLRDSLGLQSTASPIHGFRHTFKTLCREVGIAEDVHDAITGHAGGATVARGYGTMPLSRMANELAKFPPIPS